MLCSERLPWTKSCRVAYGRSRSMLTECPLWRREWSVACLVLLPPGSSVEVQSEGKEVAAAVGSCSLLMLVWKQWKKAITSCTLTCAGWCLMWAEEASSACLRTCTEIKKTSFNYKNCIKKKQNKKTGSDWVSVWEQNRPVGSFYCINGRQV